MNKKHFLAFVLSLLKAGCNHFQKAIHKKVYLLHSFRPNSLKNPNIKVYELPKINQLSSQGDPRYKERRKCHGQFFSLPPPLQNKTFLTPGKKVPSKTMMLPHTSILSFSKMSKCESAAQEAFEGPSLFCPLSFRK